MESVWKAGIALLAKRYSTPSLKFVYNPKLKTIEADKQSLIWTKTHQTEVLPSCIANKMDNADLEIWREHVSSSVVQPKGYENSEKDRVYPEYVFGVIPNLFRSLFATYPASMKHKHVSWNGFLSANWARENTKYSIRGRPGVMITSRLPLPQLFSREMIESTVNSSLPSTWPISPTTDLNSHAIVSERVSTGSHAVTSYPHLHTIVMAYNEPLEDMHILQRGLCMTFARLLGQVHVASSTHSDARSHPASAHRSTEEPLPLSGQCIVTNGKKFTFLYLQLNTLDLESDEGIKNIVCVEGPHLLYSKVVKKGRAKVLTNVDDHVVKLLVATLTNS